MNPTEDRDREIRMDGPDQVVDGWHVRTGLDFRQVEELLDWLEMHGITQRQIQIDADKRAFVVRWRN